jgi:MYXO-CTERM domain-containing protein
MRWLVGGVAVGWAATASAVCGDRVVDDGETCDDGGFLLGDGCDADCAIEGGWVCDEATFDLVADDDLTPGYHNVAAAWTLAEARDSVFQARNSDPSVYVSALPATGAGPISFSIAVETTSDDDLIGFTLGFDPGEFTAVDASYVLVDWKQATQDVTALGGVCPAGVAAHHVSGPTSTVDLWSHSGSVRTLARGTTSGATGWVDHTVHTFVVDYTPERLVVSSNAGPELDLLASDVGLTEFPSGTFGFYNFSQEGVRYRLVSPLAGSSLCLLVDEDVDGVLDEADVCKATPEGQPVDATGCSPDERCPCDDPWADHDAYVACVTLALDDAVTAGHATPEQAAAGVAAAAASHCGVPPDTGDTGDTDTDDTSPPDTDDTDDTSPPDTDDTDPDTDTSDTDDSDTDDTDPDSDVDSGGTEGGSECGCASQPSTGGVFAVAAGLVLVARRRRR